MQFASHGNGRGLNDLYILPETDKEKEIVTSFCKDVGIRSLTMFSASGDWKGKIAFEIPFGEGWKEDLIKYAKERS